MLADDNRDALRRRDEAVERRRTTSDIIGKAQTEAETAEEEELANRTLLDRLEAASKARDAAERRAEWEKRLQHGEQLRATIEGCEAQLSSLRLPKAPSTNWPISMSRLFVFARYRMRRVHRSR